MTYAETHINRCNEAASKNPEALFRIIFLASSSIRIHSKQFWSLVAPISYKTYIKCNRDIHEASKRVRNFSALKNKYSCIEYAEQNKSEIFKNFKTLNPKDFYLWIKKNVPGLGPAKAAFVSQMCNGYLGCLDTVNLKRFGIEKGPTTPKKYIETFNLLGESSVDMWKNWCESQF